MQSPVEMPRPQKWSAQCIDGQLQVFCYMTAFAGIVALYIYQYCGYRTSLNPGAVF